MGKFIAVITARGGSKRIPRKNIKDFLGSPIIKYPIEAALEANCFDEVMVSTDDREIASIAKSFGAKIPFLRSAASSSDFASTADVLKEVILEYKKRSFYFEYLCCIYPTAPFVTADKLRKAATTLKTSGADCVLTVTRFSYPIQRALIVEDGGVRMIWPENYNVRSQDFPIIYHDCGQFYCMRTESLMDQMKLIAAHTIPFEVPASETQDIDNDEDWKIAELKYRTMKGL